MKYYTKHLIKKSFDISQPSLYYQKTIKDLKLYAI